MILALLREWFNLYIRGIITMARRSKNLILQMWKHSAKVRDMFACWSNLSILKLQSIELEIAQFNNANASSLSKLDNSDSDNEDTTTWPTTTNITLHHVHVNAIADYYNIPQLKELANTKIQYILKTSWSADGFPDVIKDVFSWTGNLACTI